MDPVSGYVALGSCGGMSGTAPQTPKWAPWGTKSRMRGLAIIGPVLTIALLVLGVLLLDSTGKPVVLALGLALAIFWAIMIPLARRRNKI